MFYIKVDMKIMRLKNDGLDLLDIGGIKESSDRGYFIESKHQIVDKPGRRVAESSPPPPHHHDSDHVPAVTCTAWGGEGRHESRGSLHVTIYTSICIRK